MVQTPEHDELGGEASIPRLGGTPLNASAPQIVHRMGSLRTHRWARGIRGSRTLLVTVLHTGQDIRTKCPEVSGLRSSMHLSDPRTG